MSLLQLYSTVGVSDVVWLVALFVLLYGLVYAGERRGLVLPPGPTPLPLIGNLLNLMGADPHIRMTQMARKFGDVYQVWIGMEKVVVINDIDLAKEALVKNGDDFAGRAPLPTTNLLSNSGMGIAFADYGRGWRIHKKLTHSSLKMFGNGMQQLESRVSEEADWLCSHLAASAGRPLDPYMGLNVVIGNIISRLCLGKRYDPEDPEFKTIVHYNEGLVDTVGKDGLIDVFPVLAKLPNATVRKMKECLGMRNKVLSKNIEEHRATYKDGKIRDLIDTLLKAQAEAVMASGHRALRHLSDDHILITVNDVFGGGMETATTTLRWILLFLVHYPEVQGRIQREMHQVLCANDPVRLCDRERLPYLEATIREVLRMRPVAPLAIPHKTIRDTSVGDFDVPQGTRVMFNLWAIHHDERHWTDPAKFNPDRFLDTKTGQLLRGGSFLPFLAGCRGCLGESMAKAELFLFTARILRDFRLELPAGASPPSLQGRYGVVMAPDRYSICFRPREEQM
ncbi:steroid 17-alpha-hydroxylase/17,20 lyase-like [Branchiostoma lanceolatum]|uniref:steroid 17-alpha-hydroxylase/17,20 lyase-like n=1 Tax=Branchiostoma lanceolatum TaxID=7740 RepID=UPI00345733B3